MQEMKAKRMTFKLKLGKQHEIHNASEKEKIIENSSKQYWRAYTTSDEALWRLTVSPICARSNPHNMGVDGTRHTILHLCIQLRKGIIYKRMPHFVQRKLRIKMANPDRISTSSDRSKRLLSQTQASWTSLTAACSTMFLTRNLLIALSQIHNKSTTQVNNKQNRETNTSCIPHYLNHLRI